MDKYLWNTSNHFVVIWSFHIPIFHQKLLILTTRFECSLYIQLAKFNFISKLILHTSVASNRYPFCSHIFASIRPIPKNAQMDTDLTLSHPTGNRLCPKSPSGISWGCTPICLCACVQDCGLSGGVTQ